MPKKKVDPSTQTEVALEKLADLALSSSMKAVEKHYPSLVPGMKSALVGQVAAALIEKISLPAVINHLFPEKE